MTFRIFPYIFLLSLGLFFSSCQKKEKKDNLIAEVSQNKDSIVRMAPYTISAPELTADYVNDKKASIDRFFKKYWPKETDNICLLVAKDGQIIYENYQGIADRKKKTQMTSSTPLHIASVSKVITATAILELIDVGKLQLDQKVESILPGFPYSEVTIKTLLNHRSGLKSYAYFTEDRKIWNKKNVLKNQDVLDLMVKHKIALEFKTDKKFSYSNTNYAILALIIEKVTGMRYPAAMQKMIFEPLEMNDTFVFDYDMDREKIIPSYKGNNVEIGLDHLDAIYGDKNIYSTPRDLMKFDMARYSPDFLSPELQKQVYVGYSYEHKGEKNYGLGIRIIEWVTGQHFYFHNGWWHGNTSSYVNLKKERVTIIALSNKFSWKTYKVRYLATLFGDYPFKLDKDHLPE